MENDLKEESEVMNGGIMRRRTGRFIVVALSGALMFFGLSILKASIPSDSQGIIIGLVVIGIGAYMFTGGTRGA